MRRVIVATVIMMFVGTVPLIFAAEHGGRATQEHGGAAAVKTPSADDIRTTMKNYVMDQSKATGTFDIADPETGTTRKLQLIRVHERVGKTGNYYYSCADFKDTTSGEMLDLDLDVQDQNGVLKVADVRIHKLNEKERYTYDANDNRIPVTKKEAHHEHGGATHTQEHGGTATKEHGGK